MLDKEELRHAAYDNTENGGYDKQHPVTIAIDWAVDTGSDGADVILKLLKLKDELCAAIQGMDAAVLEEAPDA